MTAPPSASALILGAGLAGLATAYHLQRGGCRVTVLHHPSWDEPAGGNPAESVSVLFGCYHETWRLLRELGTFPSGKTAVPIEFELPHARRAAYRPRPLPGKLHWPASVLTFTGLSWHDRWNLFSQVEQLWEGAESLPADLESRVADEWLASLRQSPEARKTIWNPLARLVTGNALTVVSAAVFARTLSAIFLQHASDARAIVAHDVLCSRLLRPLESGLLQAGVRIRCDERPPQLRFTHDRLAEVQLSDHTTIQADWYVAAVPHRLLPALLPERLLTRYAYFAHIAELREVPRLAVELAVRTARPCPRLVLSSEGPFHQLTAVPSGSNEAVVRVSATGDSPLAALKEEELTERARALVQRLLPEVERDLIRPLAAIQDAPLSLSPGAALLRPIQRSPIHNMVLAGAWTDTGWPPQIESALLSARRCAEAIGVRSASTPSR